MLRQNRLELVKWYLEVVVRVVLDKSVLLSSHNESLDGAMHMDTQSVASEILNECLASHQIDVDAIRADDFDAYFEVRRNALLDLVEAATCKPVSGRNDVFTVEEGINDEPSDFD